MLNVFFMLYTTTFLLSKVNTKILLVKYIYSKSYTIIGDITKLL